MGRHHRKLLQQSAQGGDIQFAAATNIDVEIPHGCVNGAQQQQAQDFVLGVVFVAKQHVGRVKRPGVKSCFQRSWSGGRHRGELYPRDVSLADLLPQVVCELQTHGRMARLERQGEFVRWAANSRKACR